MEVYSQNKRPRMPMGANHFKPIVNISSVCVKKNGLLNVNGTVTLILIITEVATIQFESKSMVWK